jgi:hypothetical protein
MNRIHILATVCVFILAGCSAQKPPSDTAPIVLHWSQRSIDRSMAYAWAKEIGKVEKSPFIVLLVHGVNVTTKDGDRWYTSPDPGRIPMEVRYQAAAIRNIWPERKLWLVICNSGAHKLDVPGVRYGRNIVWACPNTSTPFWWMRRQDWIGDTSRFDSTDGRVRLAGER